MEDVPDASFFQLKVHVTGAFQNECVMSIRVEWVISRKALIDQERAIRQRAQCHGCIQCGILIGPHSMMHPVEHKCSISIR